MDFFSHQQQARLSTRKLIGFLFLAVLSLLLITHVIFYFVISYASYDAREPRPRASAELVNYFNSELFWFITIAIIVVVLFASLYKWITLRGGGAVIAERLGGQLLSPQSSDFAEKRLLNVVQEMAIAAGMPVPPVYIIEDNGINAFAAGHTPADAVIGITRGALQAFNREQLQGVVAHEFSHILHGDARINLRLIAILHGILVLGLLGYYALRGARHSDGRAAAAVAGIGIGLVVLGYGGTFFGNLIKAAISRQREFLADASAVQYTRNPTGIAGALKVIGGSQGSTLESERVDEVTHLLFAEGKSFVANLWATHPPLEDRIRKIEPAWDGHYLVPKPPTPETADEPASAAAKTPAAAVLTGLAVLEGIQRIGVIDQEHVGYSRQLLAQFPQAVFAKSQSADGARALILAMVLNETDSSAQTDPETQHKWAEAQTQHHETMQLLRDCDETLRLPILDLCIASLKHDTAQAYAQFAANLDDYIRLDKKTNLFEWCLRRIVRHQLEVFFHGPPKGFGELSLAQAGAELSTILSLLTQLDSGRDRHALLEEVAATFGLTGIAYVPDKLLTPQRFDRAVDTLGKLRPLEKPTAIKACAMVITYDHQVKVKELEILRALSSSWDCPMPPVIPR